VAEARALAEEMARAKIRNEMAVGAQVTEDKVKVISKMAGVQQIRVEVETYEDLAVYVNP